MGQRGRTQAVASLPLADLEKFLVRDGVLTANGPSHLGEAGHGSRTATLSPAPWLHGGSSGRAHTHAYQ